MYIRETLLKPLGFWVSLSLYRALQGKRLLRRATTGDMPHEPSTDTVPGSGAGAPKFDLHVGVLHFTPTSEPFPLLIDAGHYNPNTVCCFVLPNVL